MLTLMYGTIQQTQAVRSGTVLLSWFSLKSLFYSLARGVSATRQTSKSSKLKVQVVVTVGLALGF